MFSIMYYRVFVTVLSPSCLTRLLQWMNRSGNILPGLQLQGNNIVNLEQKT